MTTDFWYRSWQDVPEMAPLRLVAIYFDGSSDVVSLTHRCFIARIEGLAPADMPSVFGPQIEAKAATEAGLPYRDENIDFPGWNVIFDYIDKHPECIRPASKKFPF